MRADHQRCEMVRAASKRARASSSRPSRVTRPMSPWGMASRMRLMSSGSTATTESMMIVPRKAASMPR